jgi:hypothetical protein
MLPFDLEDYATRYTTCRDSYLKSSNELYLATGPYKSSRDAIVCMSLAYINSVC